MSTGPFLWELNQSYIYCPKVRGGGVISNRNSPLKSVLYLTSHVVVTEFRAVTQLVDQVAMATTAAAATTTGSR